LSPVTKSLTSIGPVLALVTLVFAVYFSPSLIRLYQVIHLYDEDRIVDNFLNMRRMFPARDVRPGDRPFEFRRAEVALPETFYYEGKEFDLERYLADSHSTGMLVLKDDVIVYERYWLGHHEGGTHISWSVAKSFVSALVGIALAEGKIESTETPVTHYLPELLGTSYDGVSIRDLLEMSSGVGFNEDYADYDSDINRFGRTIAFGKSMASFAKSLTRAHEPGRYHHYVSIDTQVLGMLLVRTTGVTLARYLEKKIWRRIGMEHPAYWVLDSTGMEAALGGLNASLRDYARFGWLFLNEGRFRGEQIVPLDWVRASTTARAPHLLPGRNNPASSSSWGYGYQWWIPEPDAADYTAAGIYDQYIYVNPERRIVVAKNSANHRYIQASQATEGEHVAMFRAIAAGVDMASPLANR